MKTENVLLGIVAGVAAGAILGVLYAPLKGSETRRNIANKSNKTANGLKDIVEELMFKITDKLDDIKEEFVDAYKKNIGDMAMDNKSI